MQDFTLTTYKKFLHELLASGYSFQTLQDFIKRPQYRTIILRHDVDRLPENALVIAKIEKRAGIKASYYFRIVKESYDEDVIRQIAAMGHEIGYHYENLSEVSRKKNPQITQIDADYLISHRHTQTHTDTDTDVLFGRPDRIKKSHRFAKKKEFRDKLFELAICDFERNLEKFRKLYPVKTICMHGSPLSKWDNRDLWTKYNYRDFGIIAEPYFDINFDEVFYLTDTGRRWDGDKVSIRDKVKKTGVRGQGSGVSLREDEKVRRLEGWNVGTLERGNVGTLKRKKEFGDLKLRTTWDIIKAAERGLLPDKVMINVHPQRWTDNPVEWMKELVWQNVKNVVKYFYVRTLKR